MCNLEFLTLDPASPRSDLAGLFIEKGSFYYFKNHVKLRVVLGPLQPSPIVAYTTL